MPCRPRMGLLLGRQQAIPIHRRLYRQRKRTCKRLAQGWICCRGGRQVADWNQHRGLGKRICKGAKRLNVQAVCASLSRADMREAVRTKRKGYALRSCPQIGLRRHLVCRDCKQGIALRFCPSPCRLWLFRCRLPYWRQLRKHVLPHSRRAAARQTRLARRGHKPYCFQKITVR